MEYQHASTERLDRLLKYLEYTPDNLNLLIDAITVTLELKHPETERLITQALQYHPDAAEINAHAGLFHLQRFEYEQAQKHLQCAIDCGISAEAVTYNLAYSHYQLRNFDTALATLTTLEPTNDLHKERAILTARCKYNIGELQDAAEILKQFLVIAESDQDAEGLLALILYDDDQQTESIYYANKSLSHSKPCFDGLLARASVAIISNDFNHAYADFKKAVNINPHSGRALSGLAQIDFYNFQFDLALENLQRAVEFMPDHIGTWHLLGWTQLMKNDFQAALGSFEKSYELDRSFGETHGCLASAHALIGDKAKAEKHIKLAEKLGPNSFGYIYAKMVLLNQSSRQQDALALFEQAKATHYPSLGTTPFALVESRLKELSTNHPQN